MDIILRIFVPLISFIAITIASLYVQDTKPLGSMGWDRTTWEFIATVGGMYLILEIILLFLVSY